MLRMCVVNTCTLEIYDYLLDLSPKHLAVVLG